jgi:hypothetical protein
MQLEEWFFHNPAARHPAGGTDKNLDLHRSPSRVLSDIARCLWVACATSVRPAKDVLLNVLRLYLAPSELSVPPVAAPARAMAVEELLARVDDQAHMECTVLPPLKLIWVVPERQ